ncbi:MAG: LysR family transcriptional regulator [Pelosinus sp.]|nr:LysR family transcriptional regulator [Pelosinus sp.]
MEWHQLESFRMVAKLQHITKAAEQLSISQPALSRSICRLEEELGFPLFKRQGKSVILNHYGVIFLRHVERALQEVEKGKKEVHDLLDPDFGTVSIAFIHSMGSNIIPQLVGRFREKYPGIQFRLSQNASNFLLEQLEAGEIDLCLCSPGNNKESIDWAPLFKEELFIAVHKGHRLAGQSSIRLEEIAAEPIITVKKNYGLRILAEQYFGAAGFTPNIAFEGEEILTLAGFVEAKLGVALIPHIMGLDDANICFLPIAGQECHRIIEVAWVKDRYMSPAVRKFKNFIIQSFVNNGL